LLYQNILLLKVTKHQLSLFDKTLKFFNIMFNCISLKFNVLLNYFLIERISVFHMTCYFYYQKHTAVFDMQVVGCLTFQFRACTDSKGKVLEKEIYRDCIPLPQMKLVHLISNMGSHSTQYALIVPPT
jgi:hypothetical protein